MTIAAKPPYNAHWERIRKDFLRTGDWARALAERTASVDELVNRAAAEWLLPATGTGLAVLAVGGYGRRELFPYSDVDLLLLFETERLAGGAKEAISRFLQVLWDAGLRLSHSVRTPGECAELHDGNIELNISLLDHRFLTGDRALYAGMAGRLPRFLQSERDALIRHLSRLTRERHARYQQTYHHLEPNIKEGPGGFRDYQLLRWLEQIHRAPADQGEDLRAAWQFLARLRCSLHYRAGRDGNTLTFEAQELAAEQWGANDDARWMREYFRHARAIYRRAMRALEAAEGQSSALLAQFREWRTRLSNAEFSVSRERVHLRAPQQLDSDPMLLLRLFQFVARHGVRLSAETEQRLADRLPRLAEWFAHSRPTWTPLSELLSLPHTVTALRAMHETGALRVIFPEMERIDCLVVRDFYHRYTVDEHCMVAIRSLAALGGSEDAELRPYADLLSELERPATLFFALLYHDIGKAAGEGRHVDGSLEAAESAMARVQMPPQERKMVRFLIREHLIMPAILRSRDLYDPATARELAHRVETPDRLKALTLLTYADLSAVNPGVMSPWRAEQLWQLCLLGNNELTRELESDRIEGPVAVPFLEGFPTRYLRMHSETELEEHLALEQKSRARGVAVDLRRLETAYQLTLVTRDRPFLFASVAGTLSSFGMNILKAEAFSNRGGTVLDTFTFADPSRTLELNPSETDRLRTVVERVVLGKVDVKQLLQHRPKPPLPSKKSRIKPTVSLDGEASNSATLIEIVAEDRPGLLYDLASTLSIHGCNIEVVLIDTEAHKAIDVFFVTVDGKKLEPELGNRLTQALLQACPGN